MTNDERRARLATELRANLHRRKAQARAVAAQGAPQGDDRPTPLDQPEK
ncbi:hypothetical protein [Sphingomonas sp.]|nr:hypothetical protein [Sphingomonas sp.]